MSAPAHLFCFSNGLHGTKGAKAEADPLRRECRRAELSLGGNAEVSASTGLQTIGTTGCSRHDPLDVQRLRVHGETEATAGTSRSHLSSTDVPSD